MLSQKLYESLREKQLSFEPKKQSFYTFSDDTWLPLTETANQSIQADRLTSLALVSWNIDFMAPEPQARMASALKHLETVVSTVPLSSAVVIFL